MDKQDKKIVPIVIGDVTGNTVQFIEVHSGKEHTVSMSSLTDDMLEPGDVMPYNLETHEFLNVTDENFLDDLGRQEE